MPRFDVHLIRFGPAVSAPADELRKVFPIDARKAEAIVTGLPKVVKRNAPEEVAETIAKALRDLGAEVECTKSHVAETPVVGSLRSTGLAASAPSDKPRRMRATAVAGSFLPSDIPPGPEPPKEPSLPPPSLARPVPPPAEPSARDGAADPDDGDAASPKKSPAIPDLTLDFDSIPPERRPRNRRGSSSAPPPRAEPAPAQPALAPSHPAPALSQPAPSQPPPAPSQPPPATAPPRDAAAATATAAVGALGAIELAVDGDQPVPGPRARPITTPPVAASSPPTDHSPSEASRTERRDILVAGALLGAIALAIGYRFATYVERPQPTADDADEQEDSIEARLASGALVDAAAFVKKGGEIVTASPGHSNVAGLVDKLYGAGAVMVYAEPETPSRLMKAGGLVVALALVVELPGDDDALDPIVAEYAAWSGRLANTITLDELESHSMGHGYWRMRVDVEGM